MLNSNKSNVYLKKITNQIFLILFLLLTLIPLQAFAITSYGEGSAKIKNGDKDSAEAIALNYAKLEAIENVSNINIKSDALVKNSKLVDETIKKEFSGEIKEFKILEVINRDGFITVKIKAEIDYNNLSEIKNVKKTNGDSVFLAVYTKEKNGKYTSNNIVTTAIQNEFENKNIEVNKYPITEKITKNIIDSIMSNNYIKMSKDFINTKYSNIVIGIIDYKLMTTDGGYGDTKFIVANGNFTWNLFSKENNTFKLTNSSNMLKRGMGATDSVATMCFNKNVAKSSFKIVSDISESIFNSQQKTIKISFGNKFSFDDLMELKKVLQNIPFLVNVNLKDNEFLLVDYGEKPYYLGIFLEDTKKYVVKEIKNNELVIIKI